MAQFTSWAYRRDEAWRRTLAELLATDCDGDPNPEDLDIADAHDRYVGRLEHTMPLAITPTEADARLPAWASSISGDVEPRAAGVWLTWAARQARHIVERERQAKRRHRHKSDRQGAGERRERRATAAANPWCAACGQPLGTGTLLDFMPTPPADALLSFRDWPRYAARCRCPTCALWLRRKDVGYA